MKKFIVISGVCCVGSCRRVSVVAERFSDGWITRCDKHPPGTAIQLDAKALDKIIAAQKMERHVQTRS